MNIDLLPLLNNSAVIVGASIATVCAAFGYFVSYHFWRTKALSSDFSGVMGQLFKTPRGGMFALFSGVLLAILLVVYGARYAFDPAATAKMLVVCMLVGAIADFIGLRNGLRDRA